MFVEANRIRQSVNIMSFPPFQDLLSKIGHANRWWIIGGAIAIGFGVFFYFVMRLRRTRKGVAKEFAALWESHLETKSAQSELIIVMKKELRQEMEAELKKLVTRMEGLDESDNSLGSRIEGLDQRLKDVEHEGPNLEGADSGELPDKSAEILLGPKAIRPPGQILIGEMLEWVKAAGLLLKPVKETLGLFGNLSPSDEGDNWLAEDSQKEGASFLFPRPERFETPAHYEMYRSYYDCVQPAAGRIMIESPAIVETDLEQGGWKLATKGELSVIP
jgi:hypothetical protein